MLPVIGGLQDLAGTVSALAAGSEVQFALNRTAARKEASWKLGILNVGQGGRSFRSDPKDRPGSSRALTEEGLRMGCSLRVACFPGQYARTNAKRSPTGGGRFLTPNRPAGQG